MTLSFALEKGRLMDGEPLVFWIVQTLDANGRVVSVSENPLRRAEADEYCKKAKRRGQRVAVTRVDVDVNAAIGKPPVAIIAASPSCQLMDRIPALWNRLSEEDQRMYAEDVDLCGTMFGFDAANVARAWSTEHTPSDLLGRVMELWPTLTEYWQRRLFNRLENTVFAGWDNDRS